MPREHCSLARCEAFEGWVGLGPLPPAPEVPFLYDHDGLCDNLRFDPQQRAHNSILYANLGALRVHNHLEGVAAPGLPQIATPAL